MSQTACIKMQKIFKGVAGRLAEAFKTLSKPKAAEPLIGERKVFGHETDHGGDKAVQTG